MIPLMRNQNWLCALGSAEALTAHLISSAGKPMNVVILVCGEVHLRGIKH